MELLLEAKGVKKKPRSHIQEENGTENINLIVLDIENLESNLRRYLQVDTENRRLRSVARKCNITHTWLIKFRDGQDVCLGILNSLANHYGVNYVLSNEIKGHENKLITDIRELIKMLRYEVSVSTANRELRKTARQIGVDHSWLSRFKSGAAICMKIMDKLATYYSISYEVQNFNDEELLEETWKY